jgi:plasmid maintenance system antidote protein VapI
MDSTISLIKGIHPGIILERELKKRKLGKGRFALSINEFPQTLTSITKGKRRMNTALSLKIERALNMEEGYLMILQTYNDIEQEKKKLNVNYYPDLSLIRPVIFWDTDINEIDWDKNKSSVIQRIFERGNEPEIKEIIRFYGNETILSILNQSINLLPQAIENKDKYLFINGK